MSEKRGLRLFGVAAKEIGGDTGYAGTANRDLCKELKIQTSFVKRRKPFYGPNEKDFVRKELARVRATAMEGSFVTQKELYAMRRIKAKRKERRSFTSSSESTPPMWFIWRNDWWSNDRRKRRSRVSQTKYCGVFKRELRCRRRKKYKNRVERPS